MYKQSPSLARRLLFPHHQTDLPRLLQAEELDEEVYDLIALSLRAFVNTWWTRLTRYDKEFLPQITTIIIHVVHALEQRLLDADLALLVFGDIPALITQHYRDYRQAASKASTSYSNGGALSLSQLFHQLQPHMAVSSDGSIDEEYFRQAFDHILKECLPAEDYAPEAERFIVREIMLKVVVKDVIPLITQPWFLHKTMLDILGPCADVSSEQPMPLSKSSILVLLLSVVQRLSGMCIMLIHAYKQIIFIIPIVNQTRSPTSSGSPDLTRGLLDMISEVLHIQDRLAASAVVQIVSLFCRAFQTFMNKLLCYLLYTHVLSLSTMLTVVRRSKQTLFPNGYPGPTPIDPTVEEQVVIRTQLVKRLSECVPSDGCSLEMTVDALSDRACNAHLAVFLLDAMLLSVFPEMGS